MRLDVPVTMLLVSCLWPMSLLSNRQFTEHRIPSFVRSRLYFRDGVGHDTGQAGTAPPELADRSYFTGRRTRFWWTRRNKRHENMLNIDEDIHYLLLLFFEVWNREFESARMKSKLFAVLHAVTTSQLAWRDGFHLQTGNWMLYKMQQTRCLSRHGFEPERRSKLTNNYFSSMFAWFSRSNYSQSYVGSRPLYFHSTTI